MKPETIKSDWKEIKGLIKAKFDKLNDESINAVEHNLDILSDKLQSVYGYAKEQAEKELENFKATLHEATKPEKEPAKVIPIRP